MKQIRIVRAEGFHAPDERRFTCEWMEASQMNRWFLKLRLAEAEEAHGLGTYLVETRDKARADVAVLA